MSVEQENTPKSMGEDDLPDWLKEIRGQSTTTPKSNTPAESQAASTSDDLPSWLQEAQADDNYDDAVEEPVVEDTTIDLSADSADVMPATDVDDMDDDLRRLLAEEGIEMDTLDEDRPAGSEDMSVRDWIAATSTESPLATSQASAYDVGDSATEEAALASESDDDDDDDLPTWLQADASSNVPETPAWLADEATHDEVEDEPIAATIIDDNEAIPTWLSEESTLDNDSDTPSWLADETSIDEVEADEPTASPVAETETTLAEDDDLVDDDDLPDWLREGGDLTGDLETPAWLADETTHDENEDSPEINTLEVMSAIADPALDDGIEALLDDKDLGGEEDDGIVIEDELPDWLRADANTDDIAAIATEGDTPSWLTDETTHDDEPEDITTAETVDMTITRDSKEADFSTDDDLPDWLSDEQSETEITDELSWLNDDAEETLDSAIFDDTLNEDRSVDEEIDVLLAEVSQDGDDEEPLPDWLQGNDVDSSDVDNPELDATLASVTESAIDDNMVDVDSLPDWLREEQSNLEADSSDTEFTEIEADTIETAEPVVADITENISEDVPDWLKEEVEEHLSTDNAVLTDEPLAGTEDIDEDSDDTTVPVWLEKLRGKQTEVTAESEHEPEVIAQEEVTAPVEEPSRITPITVNNGTISDRLATANQTLQAGQFKEALAIYQQLVAESQSLEQVIEALEGNTSHHQAEAAIYELLGDAHLKLGDHSQALTAYQHALDNL